MGGSGRSGPPVIRIVWGTGTGPTAVASYDAALAEAGLAGYNLSAVSSIIPAEVTVEEPGTAPTLGQPGDRLTVVEARSTVEAGRRATAGIGWVTGDGPGVFYEAQGEFDEPDARSEIRRGLAAARDLREWRFSEEAVRTTSRVVDEGYGTAVVIAAYGVAEPIFGG